MCDLYLLISNYSRTVLIRATALKFHRSTKLRFSCKPVAMMMIVEELDTARLFFLYAGNEVIIIAVVVGLVVVVALVVITIMAIIIKPCNQCR